jgi:hypothetical protein
MTTIDEAKNMRSGINVEGTVERKEEVRTVNTKAGSTVDVANAMLVDNGMELRLHCGQKMQTIFKMATE